MLCLISLPNPAMMALVGTLLFNPMTTTTMKYEFGNGPVQIDSPMIFQGLTLVDPEFIGVGGGGAVYSYKNTNRIIDEKNIIAAKNYEKSKAQEQKIVVKISWKRSADSVQNECDVLRVMEQRHVTGVERCLGMEEYRYDSNRVVVGMVPFVEDQQEGGGITASIGELSPDIALNTVTYLMKTMVQMLVAGVVTNDVQPLISKSTGEIVLIDMTEATVLYRDDNIEKGSYNSYSDNDKILINAFCTEVIGLIPDNLLEKASESFLTELYRIETETNIQINNEIKQIIRDLPITGVENLL